MVTKVKGASFDLQDNQALSAETLGVNDTTPSVASSSVVTTANAVATTITDFDGGVGGQVILVIFNDNNTLLDFASDAALKGHRKLNRTMVTGEHMIAIANSDASAWYCQLFPRDGTIANPGIIEVATAAETNVGNEAARCVSPDGLAGSYAGTKTVAVNVFSPDVSATTGNAKQHYVVTSDLNGMDLIGVEACVAVAGVTATMDVQVHNLTDANHMLTTVMTIDTTEVSTTTAATPAVINTATDDVVTDDIIRIDVDAIHSGTAAKGLTVFLTFRLP